MNRSTPSTSPAALAGRGARATLWLGALLLLALAVWAVTRSGAGVSSVMPALRGAPAWKFALLLGLITGTLPVTSWTLWVLTRRYGALGLGENTALITSAWLLNFAPVAPGLFGRLAYLKLVNGIRVNHSARVILWARLLGVLASGGMALWLALLTSLGQRGEEPLFAVLASAPIVPIWLLARYARHKRPQPDPEVWRIIGALGARVVELHLWGARYWAAFSILGQPLAWGGALALACIANLAASIPLAPNGLGLREWAVGLVTPLLPTALAYAAGVSTPGALSAELVHRAAEVLVAVPLGLIATAWVGVRVRRAASSLQAGPGPDDGP